MSTNLVNAINVHNEMLRAAVNGDDSRESLLARVEALDWSLPMVERIAQALIQDRTYTAPRGWSFQPSGYELRVLSREARGEVTLEGPTFILIGNVRWQHGDTIHHGTGKLELNERASEDDVLLRATYRHRDEWKDFGGSGRRTLARAVFARFKVLEMSPSYWKVLAREIYRNERNSAVYNEIAGISNSLASLDRLTVRAENAI